MLDLVLWQIPGQLFSCKMSGLYLRLRVSFCWSSHSKELIRVYSTIDKSMIQLSFESFSFFAPWSSSWRVFWFQDHDHSHPLLPHRHRHPHPHRHVNVVVEPSGDHQRSPPQIGSSKMLWPIYWLCKTRLSLYISSFCDTCYICICTVFVVVLYLYLYLN